MHPVLESGQWHSRGTTDGYSRQELPKLARGLSSKARHSSCSPSSAMDNRAKICAIAFVFLMVGCEEATKEKEQDGAAGASNGAAGASNGAAGASNGAAGAQCADG